MGDVILMFGCNKGKQIREVEDQYLIWIVKTYRGDYKPRGFDRFNQVRFTISEDVYIHAREVLKERGYRFIGNRIEKDE